jgi:murein DD-endopeptidase MepM/ murein hydrolase activator NlpD
VAVLVATTAGAYVPGQGTSQTPEPGRAAPAEPAEPLRPNPSTTKEFEELLAKLDSKERRLTEELESLDPKGSMVRRRMIARGRAYYRLVRAGLLPVGGGFDALVDHATRVEQLRAALTRDLGEEQRIDQRRQQLEQEIRRAKAERAPLQVHQQALLRAGAAMREADERRAAFLRAFGASGAGDDHMAIYGASTEPLDPGQAPTEGFESMRGRLSFPLAGRAEVPSPSDPRSGNGPGLLLVATSATAVRAVYPGRVVLVGPYLDYGQTVLVDHGERYFTVYGRLSRAEVKLGDSIPERGRLGWITRHGGHRPTLYFEIRRGTAPLDAASWLGL